MSVIEQVREYMEKVHGVPKRDLYDLPTSKKKFPDNADYRFETVPQNLEEVERLFSAADKYDFVINKITECRGIMYDCDEDILKMAELCREHGAELCLSNGPRCTYDISKDSTTGCTNLAFAVRGMDQLVNAIVDIIHGVELGCRYVRVNDLGVLTAVSDMRKRRLLPPDLKFKISADWPTANPLALKNRTILSGLLNVNDTINIARDLPLPLIAAMRSVTDNPLDVHVHHTYCPPAIIIRNLDSPEITRICRPVYFKSSIYHRADRPEEYRMLKAVKEAIERHFPEARQSKPGAKGLAVPAKPGEWKFPGYS